MSQDTCAVLTAVFPVVLFTILFNGRSMGRRYRRGPWYVPTIAAGIVGGLGGTVFTVVGVQTQGLWPPFAATTWLLFLLEMVSLVVVFLLANTYDDEDKNRLGPVGEWVERQAARPKRRARDGAVGH